MVCTQEDEFTRSRFISDPRWVATLSDGRTVISDDGRPGTDKSAWLRLADELRGTGVRITALELRFRSRVEHPVPPDADGYFFRTAAGAFMTDRVTLRFFLVGHLRDGKVHVTRWEVPALLPVDKEVRDPADAERVGPSLIRFEGQGA